MSKLYQLATLEQWFGVTFDADTIHAYVDGLITLREIVRRYL